MIQLTLTFPTVAAARKVLLELPENLFADAEVKAAEPKKEAPAKKEEPKAAKPEPVATPTTAEATAAPEPKVETFVPVVEYPTLQKAVFALAGKSREAAAAVAASFGVKTFKELDQTKWVDALAAVQAKTAELEAA